MLRPLVIVLHIPRIPQIKVPQYELHDKQLDSKKKSVVSTKWMAVTDELTLTLSDVFFLLPIRAGFRTSCVLSGVRACDYFNDAERLRTFANALAKARTCFVRIEYVILAYVCDCFFSIRWDALLRTRPLSKTDPHVVVAVIGRLVRSAVHIIHTNTHTHPNTQLRPAYTV